MATLRKQKGLGILTKILECNGSRVHILHFDNGKTLYKRLSVGTKWKVLFYQKDKQTADSIRGITPDVLAKRLYQLS